MALQFQRSICHAVANYSYHLRRIQFQGLHHIDYCSKPRVTMEQAYMSSRRSLHSFHDGGHVLVSPPINIVKTGHDVFINHRGIDTKRNVAGLLYLHLTHLRLKPFLDCYSMKPGDSLHDDIRGAILGCKVGVAIFSPRYCESTFCLRELVLMMEAKKKVIPIFCDVKPSHLRTTDDYGRFGSCTPEEVVKFRSALDEVTRIVGLNFNSSKGDWLTLLKDAGDAITEYL